MNIQTIANDIKFFNEEIVESGFKRDIQDLVSSLPNNQNNIVTLRESANKVFDFLNELYNSDFPESLKRLLPDKKVPPFTEQKSFEQLKELISDKQIAQPAFFQKLNQILTQLNQQIITNFTKINEIQTFLTPYLSTEKELIAKEHKAIISIIFKEKQTITNLKYFTKNIQAWNRILPLYHQVLKSSSPEEIEILEVQNGSIDFIFNFDFDIALNLVDLFKEGFKCYLAYLSYKTMSGPIAQTFLGNKDLMSKQKEIEDGMLDNIGTSILQKAIAQYKKAKKIDTKIDSNIDKKVDQISKLISSHIIKGNDIKLLAIPESTEKETNDKEIDLGGEIRKISTEVRNKLKSLPVNEMKKLLDKYGKIDNDID